MKHYLPALPNHTRRLVKQCVLCLFLPLISLLPQHVFAQYSQQWISQPIRSSTESNETFTAQTTDRQHNVIMASYNGKSKENTAIALTKYNPQGQRLWSTKYTADNTKWQTPVGIKTDAINNIYLVGWSQLTEDDGTYFISKFTAAGNQVWSRSIGSKYLTQYAFEVAENGDSYVIGSRQEGVGESSRILKYNTSGEEVWSADFIGTDGKGGEPTALALDNAGNLLVGGALRTYNYPDPVVQSARLIKYNAENGSKNFTGNYISDDTQFQEDYETMEQVLVAGNGDTYLVSQKSGFNVFQVILYKLSSSGDMGYSKAVGLTEESTHIEAVLNTDSQITLLNRELKYRDVWDYFLTAFNSTGQRLYYTKYNEYIPETSNIRRVVPRDLDAAPDGRVAVVGLRDFIQRPPAWFENPPVIEPARSTAILYNLTGTETWQETRRGTVDDWETAYQVNFISDRSFYLSGRRTEGASLVVARYTNCNDFAVSVSQSKSICRGGEVRLEASATAATYVWSPATGLSAANVANPVASPEQTTTYTVTATNPDGCTATAQVTVTVTPQPQVSISYNGPGTFCQGGSATLTANATDGVTAYQWYRNGQELAAATSSTYTATTSGAYKVRVSNGSCSETSAATEINVLPEITNNLIFGNQTVCVGARPQSITAETPRGGNGAYLYQWQRSTDGNTYSDIQGATGKNYEPGTLETSTWFRRQVASGNCTSVSGAVKITLEPLPQVALAAFAQSCQNDNAIALTGGSPAGGTYTGNGVINGMFYPREAGVGTHTITYTYTTAVGCSQSATQNIVVASCSVTSIPQDDVKFPVSVYPNPTRARVQIEMEMPTRTDLELVLTDASGRVIYSKSYKGQLKVTESIQLGKYERGLYLLQVITNDGTLQRKIVVQ